MKLKKQGFKTLYGFFAALILVCGIAFSGCGSSGKSSVLDQSDIRTFAAEISEEETLTPEATETPTPAPTQEPTETPTREPVQEAAVSFDLSTVPAYSGSAYVAVNNNTPFFTDDELTTTSFESYSTLDSLGRCGVAYASIGQDLMPTEERENIGSVKPSGWHTVKYNGIVDGNYLYNRCHLIGYQLTGENANDKNLITGTRYLNIEGMLPFENLTADYIKETGNHVLYRVTPIFEGNNLVASGVLMEGKSVEDNGASVQFCVYAYNVQPSITIDYATGESALNEGAAAAAETPTPTPAAAVTETPAGSGTTYILNTNTMKFHYPACRSINQMKESNKAEYTGSRDDLIAQGYEPCKNCNP